MKENPERHDILLLNLTGKTHSYHITVNHKPAFIQPFQVERQVIYNNKKELTVMNIFLNFQGF